jgi:hypothetical protein
MGVFDQAARFAAKSHPEVVPGLRLISSGLRLRFREWIDTRSLPLPGGPDRTADLVAALDDQARPDKPWLVVLEFQAQTDADKLDVTFEESGILRNRVRHGPTNSGRYNVVVMIVYLRGRCPVDVLDMTTPDGMGTRHAPLVWNVEGDDAAGTVEAVANGVLSPGMLFWVPLMTGANQDSLVDRWNEVSSATIPDRSKRGDLASVAMVFAELAGRVPEWRRGLEGFEMTESMIVNEWIRQGEVRGLLSANRQTLLRILERKFAGVIPSEVARVINQQESLELLVLWIDEAISANSIDEFTAVLRR